MEFLLLWVLGGHFVDSGLRYREVGDCYAAAQNAGSDIGYVGLNLPKYTCVPLKEGRPFAVHITTPNSRFPF